MKCKCHAPNISAKLKDMAVKSGSHSFVGHWYLTYIFLDLSNVKFIIIKTVPTRNCKMKNFKNICRLENTREMRRNQIIPDIIKPRGSQNNT